MYSTPGITQKEDHHVIMSILMVKIIIFKKVGAKLISEIFVLFIYSSLLFNENVQYSVNLLGTLLY